MITADTAKRLREAMKEVNQVLAKHNLVGSIGTIRFNPNEMRTKLTVVQLNGKVGGDPKAVEKAQFAQYAAIYGLTASDYGRKVMVSGIMKPVTLVGIRPSSRKYPLIVETARGKRYKISKASLRSSIPVLQAA